MTRNRKIIVCLLLGVFIVASFPPVLAQEWGTLEDGYFIVKYPPGYEDDANKILEYANFALQVVMEKYPHELSQKVVICLYDYSNYNDPPYVTRYDSGKREISLLAPSDQPAQYRSWCDDLWYQSSIIHEYVHVPFYQDLSYGNVPSWFSQGLAEYFSMFCSTPSILIKYESQLGKIEDMVKNGEGYLMSVGGDEYYGGAYIVKYMYGVYGQDNVTNLIKSDAVSFIPALEKELNVTPREFEDKWLKWACEEFGADYDLYAISEAVPTVEVNVRSVGTSVGVELSETNIIGISIMLLEEIPEFTISIQQWKQKPAEVSPPPGVEYCYFDVITTVEISSVKSTCVDFKVEKSWIHDNQIDEGTVKLYRYDAITREWGQLPTRRIGENFTYVYYSAESLGLSIYAVSGTRLAPASFEFSNLVISPTDVRVGEPVTISVDIRNVGELQGENIVTLKINEVTVESESVTLVAEETETVTFTLVENIEGTYSVNIKELSGSFVVKRSARPFPWPLVIGIIVTILFVIAVVVVLYRRKQVKRLITRKIK